MHLSTVQLPDKSNYYSYSYGPLVLAAEFGKENQEGVFADESRGGHVAHGPQLPLNSMPVILGGSENMLSHVKQTEGQTLSFHINGLYPKQYESGFTLIPFYKLQDSRYMIYWPQADADKVVELQKKKAEQEKQERELNMISVDKITLGEQQPESDHAIESDQAYTGYMEDCHFRDARGWFSYRMFNKDRSARYLYITYFDADPNRVLNVQVNGRDVSSKILEGKSGTAVQGLLLAIPESEYSKENLTVKFSAAENTLTSKIIEVRLLKQKF